MVAPLDSFRPGIIMENTMTDFSWKDKIVDMKNPTITIQEANKELEVALDKYDWFYSSVVEGLCICVYVNEMGKEVSDIVPDMLYGYQIKLGFSSYLTCGDKYGKRPATSDILIKLVDAN